MLTRFSGANSAEPGNDGILVPGSAHLPTSDNLAKVIRRHTVKVGFYWQRRDERDNDVIRSLKIGGVDGQGPTTQAAVR